MIDFDLIRVGLLVVKWSFHSQRSFIVPRELHTVLQKSSSWLFHCVGLYFFGRSSAGQKTGR